MNADGSDQTRLTYYLGTDADPDWQPTSATTTTSVVSTIIIDENGREIRIELDFESASFEREHAGQAEKCDLVVCWRDTWGRAATKPVLELAGILY